MADKAEARERAGYSLQCPICGGQKFWKKEAQLNTKAASLLDFDWINPSGDCYICKECRYIIWFYGENEKLGD
jgi:predicted nucleic-acid-binding Zn-ribbon protein